MFFYAIYFSKLKSPFLSNSEDLSALCPVESVWVKWHFGGFGKLYMWNDGHDKFMDEIWEKKTRCILPLWNKTRVLAKKSNVHRGVVMFENALMQTGLLYLCHQMHKVWDGCIPFIQIYAQMLSESCKKSPELPHFSWFICQRFVMCTQNANLVFWIPSQRTDYRSGYNRTLVKDHLDIETTLL